MRRTKPGEKLKTWREASDLTQTEAGDRVGVSAPTWSEWEAGKKQPRHVFAIAIELVTGIPRGEWLSAAEREMIASVRRSARAAT